MNVYERKCSLYDIIWRLTLESRYDLIVDQKKAFFSIIDILGSV